MPNIPEKKSFPHGCKLFLSERLSGLQVSWICVWQDVLAGDRSERPAQVFAQEVFQTAKARMPWASKNGWAGTDQDLGKLVPQQEDAENP